MSPKLRRPRLHIALVVVLAAAAVFATTTSAARPSAYSPTLGIDFSTTAAASTATTSGSMPYATPYTVSGCDYDSSYGGVTIVVHSPEAISFSGQLPDANGCISLSNFSTQGPGHYQIDAYQQIRRKSSIVASTSFDLN
jgi:hypothetical protein